MGNKIVDFGKGVKKARKNAGFKTQQDFADKICVSIETVRNWEQGQNKPSLDDFIMLCDTLECDADYLLNTLDVQTHDLAFICDYTGLSGEAVTLLHKLKNADTEEEQRTLSLLNLVLSDPGYDPLGSMFYRIDQYIKAGEVKREIREDPEPPKTLEEFEERKSRRAFEEKIVEVQSSEDMTEVLPISGLYREFKMQQIRAAIDRYRNKGGKKNG